MDSQLKKSIFHETILFLIYALFLVSFFTAFSLFRMLVDNQFHFDTYHFGYNLIEALILSKIILLGQHFHLGEKYNDRSLIIPTLYKTLVFTLFVMLFSILEEFIMGYLRGKSLDSTLDRFVTFGFEAVLGKVLLMFFVFVFFFALQEIARIYGPTKLYNLFFRRRKVDLH